MSEEKNETVADIVAEIRAKNPEVCYPAEYGGGVVPNEMRALADRIEAAYNRLPLFTPEQLTAIAQQGCENFDLKRENARLRAALRPVLECDALSTLRCHEAVREAQRIYKN